MKLQKIVNRLQKLHPKEIDLSLDRTFNLLNKLGNPQNKLKNVITVVGTNAKASMCYSLKSILNQAGYKCNLYTSPHLQSLSERFVFNDTEIAEEDLINLLNDIERFLGAENASVFEILTCGFLKYAESFKNNINIIEAGLFHQFDSTNVFKKNLCKDCIKKIEVLEYPELGMEAVWKIEVKNFPAFVVIDNKGNDFFDI